jgi:YVTN family beta-propeller protein
MRSLPRLAARLVLPLSILLVLAGCSGPPGKKLTSIAVTPANPTIKVGSSQQFTATGTYSDNTTADVTAQVTWNSATTSVATITTGGLASGVSGGTSVISASLNGVAGQTTLTVAALSAIAVTPANPSIALGLTQQFTATGTYTDNSTSNLTSQVTWDSATKTVATISTAGLATSVATGTSVISATLGTVTGQTTLTVTPAVLASIRISPANPTIAVGQTVDFTAVGVLTDGTTQPLVGPVTWTSGTTTTATIVAPSTTGIALAAAAGTSTITATDAASTLTANTQLTVTAATSRFAFAASLGDSSVATYVVNPATGTFIPRGKTYIFGFPSVALPEPSGRFVYLPNQNQTIAIYAVDPVTGTLTDTGLPRPLIDDGGPYQGAIDPTGRYLYIANFNSNTLSAYSINTSTGALAKIGSAVTVGSNPLGIVIDHTGQFLYVANDGDATISAFSINSSTGALTPLSTPTFAVGDSLPQLMTIDPTNTVLYVANGGDLTNPGTVSAFTIGTGVNAGLLTPVSGSPFGAGLGVSPNSVAIDPSGKFAFVTNGGDGLTPGSVSVFNIAAGGGLGAPVTGSPFPAGIFPFDVDVDPGGKYIAVANLFSNSVSFYTFSSSTGVLSPARTLESGLEPVSAHLYTSATNPTVSVASAAAANATTGDISGYTASASTGGLTPAAGSPFVGISGNSFLSADPAGRLLAALSVTGKNIGSFTADSSTGIVSNLSSASLGTSVPGNLYVEATGQYIYVADTTAGQMSAFFSDPSGPSLAPAASPTLAEAGVQALVGDPGGNAVYGLANGTIYSAALAPINGTASPGVTNTIAGNWTAGAIDPSGTYLVALDSSSNTIQSFSLAPMQSTVPDLSGGAVDGTATKIGTAVPTVGTAPSTVTFDAFGRFVFVTDTAAKTIAVFTFNSSTGALGAAPAFTIPALAGTPGQVGVDSTGTYLYVAVQGATPTSVGSVAAFSINGTTGALTAVTGSPFPANQATSGVAVFNKVN